MPRKPSPTLTDAELRVMNVLWDRGPSTVAATVESFPVEERPAYNTVLTTLRILERKGYAAHEARGRAYVYRAVVGRDRARRNTIRHLALRFFDGSLAALALNIIESEDLNREELRRLRELIEESEQR